MDARLFSPTELAFLENENWFQSMRILEGNPELVNEEFSRRLALAAESCEDEEETHLLQESARIVARAVAAGVEVAAEEKLGKGGVLAGKAREARERYYEGNDPNELLRSVDQFVEALMCEDDPLAFDQGRTLQGFGATLLDLAEILPDPAVSHVGCLALLGSMTAHLAVINPYTEHVWVDRLERLMRGARRHLDRIDSFPLEASELRLYESLRRAFQLTDETLEQGAEGFIGMLDAALPVLSVALAASRTPLALPHVSTPRDERLQQAATE